MNITSVGQRRFQVVSAASKWSKDIEAAGRVTSNANCRLMQVLSKMIEYVLETLTSINLVCSATHFSKAFRKPQTKQKWQLDE